MSLSRLDIKTLKYDSLYDDTRILLIENIKKVEEVRRERISKLYSEMLDLSGYRVEEGQTDFHALSPRSEHHTHTHSELVEEPPDGVSHCCRGVEVQKGATRSGKKSLMFR